MDLIIEKLKRFIITMLMEYPIATIVLILILYFAVLIYIAIVIAKYFI